MRVLIGGSHGMIGEALVSRLLEEGHEPVRLVRQQPQEGEVFWDAYGGDVDRLNFEGFDAVVHLGGENIGERRWTEGFKQRLWDSRVVTTEVLAKILRTIPKPPEVFVCASGVGYYGSRGEEELTESSSKGEGFLADLCEMWEDATSPASEDTDIRIVNLRTAVVLDAENGALARQLPLFKLGIAGRLGSGTQYMPWISLTDQVRAIMHVIENKSISGPVNCASPDMITNIEFTSAIGMALGRPTVIPVPRWMMVLGLGREVTEQMLLTSQKVIPQKLLESGFQFQDVDMYETVLRLIGPESEHQQQWRAKAEAQRAKAQAKKEDKKKK